MHRRRSEEGESLPLVTRAVQIVEDKNPRTIVTRFWSNESAEECRLCPRPRCTFTPGANGHGSCVLIVPGLLDKESCAALRLSPALRIFGA